MTYWQKTLVPPQHVFRDRPYPTAQKTYLGGAKLRNMRVKDSTF